MNVRRSSNIDQKTVAGFGDEWAAFDQSELDSDEHRRMFHQYFRIFPFKDLRRAEGFDLGCGSGRWAFLVAPNVGKLHCIDPSPKALDVSRRRLADAPNVELHLASADNMPFADNSQDFGYSLGVLHHVPDTELALRHCVAKLKPKAPFLVYLYYRLDNRPTWFRGLWRVSDLARRLISRLPFNVRRVAADIVATGIYLPLSRTARAAERAGADVSNWPLSNYRTAGFYVMRTDALDRFGTRLEQRFSKKEIESMMHRSGLRDVSFSDKPPYWVAVGWKKSI